MPGAPQLFNKCNLFLLSQIRESANSLVQGPSAQSAQECIRIRFHQAAGGSFKGPIFTKHFQKFIKIISVEVIGPENYISYSK